MKKKGRKAKAINIVKLNEKERKKFTKKFHCKRCHSFYVDTKLELEHHMESLHGEYSSEKHRSNKKGSRKIKKIYFNRYNLKEKPIKEEKPIKLPPKDCFLCWCRNCERPVAIHMDMKQEIQDDLVCPNCRANVFVDHRAEIVDFMVRKGRTPVQFKFEYGIDTTLFKGYTEKEMKLKAKGATLGEFVNRRNGKK